jgi:DNA primase
VAGRINDEDIQALRERADVGSVIGDYTALKRAGSRLKGLCPFHNEKTPSFTVDPARGVFHCFGCGTGGDVYGFLQQIEALSFPEAVERLARIVGYELRYEELSPGQRKALGRRTRMVEVVEEAASFFVDRLAADEGAQARGYLSGRGLSAEDAAHFRLGWAPDSWDALVRHLTGKGFEHSEIVAGGLATQGRRGDLIDRFRGRVIFPIVERGGRDVVAFGGRVLPGVPLQTGPREGEPPKYINSSETEVYKKSETLYALNWARGDIQRQRTALVVEGYMDVIGLHLAGIRNAVATCGTALTTDHFRQLEKFAPRVVLALDADEAGYTAAERARALAAEVGIREVGVLPLPQGKDPADLAADGAEAVEAALEHTKTAVEFQIEHLLRGADVATPEGQVDAYRRTFPLLAQLDDRFLRYTYVRDIVAPAVRLSADHIERELDAHLAEGAVATPGAAGPRDSGSSTSGSSGSVARHAGVMEAPKGPQMVLEREVLRAALQHHDLLPVTWKQVVEEDFTAPVARDLLRAILDSPSGDLDAVLERLPDEDSRARVRALALSDTTVEPDAVHVAELVARLRAATIQRAIDAVRAELATVNPSTDPERNRALLLMHGELEHGKRELLEQREL